MKKFLYSLLMVVMLITIIPMNSIPALAEDNSNLYLPATISEENDYLYLGTDINAYSGDYIIEFPTENTKEVRLGGKHYNSGLIFPDKKSYISYNLNKEYESFEGLVGPIDWRSYTGTIDIIGDNKTLKTIELQVGQLPEKIELDVRGVSQLRFELTNLNRMSGNYYDYLFAIVDARLIKD